MTWQRFYSAASAFVAVSWFIALFFATIAIAVVSLSASQLQGRLAGLSQHSDLPLTVWQIERIRTAWERQQVEIAARQERLEAIQTDINAAQLAVTRSKVEAEGLANGYQRAEDELVAKLSNFEPLKLKDISDQSDRDRRRTLSAVWTALRPELQPQSVEQIDALSKIYLDARRAMDDSVEASYAAEAVTRQLEASREETQTLLARDEAEIAALINADGKLSPAEETRIRDLMSEFSFIKNFAFGMLYRFSVLPNELLVMVLVIAMGTLGSTLQLTYDYYRAQQGPRTSHFLLRPMLGAITALVLFIVLRAGVMVITDSSQTGEAAPLSPFFLGFLGIVAGFLSEATLEMVRGLGQSWLRRSGAAEEERPHWGQGLEAYLGEDRQLETLARRTDIDLAQLQRWFAGAEPVPSASQKIIAAWLDRDQQALFSDRPPPPAWETAPAAGGETAEEQRTAA
ncbi:hypothetical protein [Rhizobium halophytocola]|uniref:Nucleic acid-binding Zn-ribbon protein n=1 Tax=Rhizobium halophytocola TaxID=735519 RepID=A0ABS4E1H6_9HYPH|nr:hypothetical protein [Rhizobium halophytocola]MBP1851797.1 putative nucleic acid-binding Zn-ribbon protein [Rhizobium halophytocola]